MPSYINNGINTGGTGAGKKSGFVTNLFQGIGSIFKGGTSGMPTGIDGEEDMTAGARIGNALNTGLTSALAFSDINNSGLNRTQKAMARGDAAVDTISGLASSIPGIGGVIGGALSGINKLAGSLVKTPKIIKDYVGNESVANSSAFGGITAGMSDVQNSIDSFKGAGLFGKLSGKKRLATDISQTNARQNMASNIIRSNEQAKNAAIASAGMFEKNNINKLYGGDMWTTGGMQYGKNGLKFKSPDIKKIIREAKYNSLKSKPIVESTTEIEAFKKGGSINVIVDGALHARKHNLKDLEHLKDAEITTKGVPVISIAEGGEIKQHAEVEGDELVLHKSLSQTIEDLCDEGDDKSMILAGKLLAREIVKNTKDSKNKVLANG